MATVHPLYQQEVITTVNCQSSVSVLDVVYTRILVSDRIYRCVPRIVRSLTLSVIVVSLKRE